MKVRFEILIADFWDVCHVVWLKCTDVAEKITVHLSETLVHFFQATWHHNAEDNILHSESIPHSVSLPSILISIQLYSSLTNKCTIY
jgi:hypothetical protein